MKKKVEKRTCAYCKGEITAKDYRVFCPSCSADYHKDCWLINNGCVTHDCEYNRNMNAPANVCPACHTPMGAHYAYCKKCGRARTPEDNYVPYPQDSAYYVPETIYEISSKLIDTSSTYYLTSFEDIQKGNKKVFFNGFACLFSAFWFLYRKMYAQALAVGLLLLLLLISLSVFPGLAGLTAVLLIGLLACCGFFANGIYMDFVAELAEEAKDVPWEKREAYIAKKGGTLFKIKR